MCFVFFSLLASSETAEGINPRVRRLFSPLSSRSMQATSSKESLTQALFPDYQDACCFEYVDTAHMHEVPEAVTEVEVATEEIPPPLPSLGLNCSSVEQFLTELPVYSPNIVALIEQRTCGQATNDQWHLYRKGRVTGSIAHAVLTKGRKGATSDAESDMTNLVRRILGEDTIPSHIPALKYGREMEEEARGAYVKKERPLHTSFSVRECGLFVHGEKIFLAASPDGLVSCDCCGEGALEIKCPYSVSHEVPSEQNLDYLQKSGDALTVKESHQYYSQIQMQLGVLKRSWCDFFVYSRHGSVTVRVTFDEQRWAELQHYSELLFKGHIVKKLVERDTPKND